MLDSGMLSVIFLLHLYSSWMSSCSLHAVLHVIIYVSQVHPICFLRDAACLFYLRCARLARHESELCRDLQLHSCFTVPLWYTGAAFFLKFFFYYFFNRHPAK